MNKGFADYIVVSALELDRELQREFDGVEAPLFTEKYREWLKASRKLVDGSIVNYMRWLNKADAWILEYDNDFWTLLAKAWKVSDFETVKKLCAKYEETLLKEKAKAEKDAEYGESVKEIGNWISVFRSYRDFIGEQIENVEIEKQMQAALIESSRKTADHLLLDKQFVRWGIAQGIAEDTMESYVSYIKRANRDLFCKTGHDIFHEYLPVYIKTKNQAKTDEMFGAIESKLTERIDNIDETEMPIASLKNARSAIRRYNEFIQVILRR